MREMLSARMEKTYWIGFRKKARLRQKALVQKNVNLFAKLIQAKRHKTRKVEHPQKGWTAHVQLFLQFEKYQSCWIRPQSIPEGDWAKQKLEPVDAVVYIDRYIFYLFMHRYLHSYYQWITYPLILSCVFITTQTLSTYLLLYQFLAHRNASATMVRTCQDSSMLMHHNLSRFQDSSTWLKDLRGLSSIAALGRYKDLGPFEASLESWFHSFLISIYFMTWVCTFTPSWNWLYLAMLPYCPR